MRVIQRGLAIPGDALLHDFARSLRMADLSEATRHGYGADLGRFRAWIEGGRGAAFAWRRINATDLANYRQHLNYEEIMNKASCLSLISNAVLVLVWNTNQIQKIVEDLRSSGTRSRTRIRCGSHGCSGLM
jgi:hypothetical protein